MFLTALATVSLLQPVSSPVPNMWARIPHEEGVDARLLRAVCWVESNHNPKAINHYDGGAPSYGICQVKLRTARHMGFTGTVRELKDPETNIRYAARYLHYQMLRYKDWRKAVTAYNRGRWDSRIMRINNKYVIAVRLAMYENR